MSMFDIAHSRLSYSEQLLPKFGYTLDFAVCTTYSLDLEALLGVPVSLGLLEETDSDLMKSPFYILEAIRKSSDNIAIFCNVGGISLPSKIQSVYSLLENSVFEVKLEMGQNFHSKLWFIKYTNKDGASYVKILVLSRNLTFDNSIDLCVSLEGDVARVKSKKNKPLADMLNFVAKYSNKEKRQKILLLAEDILRVKNFDIEHPFEDYEFLPLGIYGYNKENTRLFDQKSDIFIVSPFLSDDIIRELSKCPYNKSLVTRKTAVTQLVLDSFDSVYITKDILNDNEYGVQQDIHAKLYFTITSDGNYLYIGSANASHNAFYNNVEFLLKLKYKPNHVGFKTFLNDFIPKENCPYEKIEFAPESTSYNDMNAEIDKAFKEVVYALDSCKAIQNGDTYDIEIKAKPLRTSLNPQISPLQHPGIVEEIKPLTQLKGLLLKELSEFYVLRIQGKYVVVKLPTKGIPAERDSAIYKGIINSKDKFLDYVSFMLSEDYASGILEINKSLRLLQGTAGKESNTQLTAGIYEKMLHAFHKTPNRITALSDLIKRLDSDVIDDKFREMYHQFMLVKGGAEEVELKDFQQATANRILDLFRSGQNRILLADEVGLGKTIIARDVVRQVGEWHKNELYDEHFKVIYICSNINIANQNARKLGIADLMNVSESRLSMQHLKIYQNKKAKHSYEQLIPLTPATSFSMTSGCGNQEERALMFAHIKRLPAFKGLEAQLSHFFAYDAEKLWERYYVGHYEDLVAKCDSGGSNYIAEMRKELVARIAANSGLAQSIIESCTSKDTSRKKDSRPLLNELRKIFAQISLDKLEPDLVIMDEFQRFSDLISPPDDEQGMLCRAFLHDTKTKVLLLSATPYKPYSTLEELNADASVEHYKEFMDVMQFLFYNPDQKVEFEKVWKDYSDSMCEISKDTLTMLVAKKNNAEDALYQGICRTERLNSGIIDDIGAREIAISDGDILGYSAMQSLLDEMSQNSKRPLRYRNVPMDYVKSSPYLLSFMESYQLKKQITGYFSSGRSFDAVKGANSKYLLLKKSSLHNYSAIPENNARLTKLKEIVFENGKNGAENLLWLPPSRAYYHTGSVFDKNKNYSKVLVFSSWEMVPRMISVMLSYEAERMTIGKLFHNAKLKRGRGYFATKEERRFGIGRLKNETEDILCLISYALARLYSPMEYIGQDIGQVRKALALKLEPKLDVIRKKYNLVENRKAGVKSLIELVKALDNRAFANPSSIPPNVLDTLINMAIGSPAICAFRLLKGNKEKSEAIAKEVFVSLFNKAESAGILDLLYGSREDDAYYESVFRYCVEGNLQAVLDEYAHILGESGHDLAESIVDSFADTASLQIDTLESFTGADNEKPRIRTHFAVGYFNARISDENVIRTEKIRKAFNSPFRPFVLSTTSIGQEGLDFHFYCRKVMHWNLPSNPIDLEQREGRINRYKCLAVRQNTANRYGEEPTWDAMFEKAAEKEKGHFSDLIPYWCLREQDCDTVKIQRIVPMYPLSQDKMKYLRLIKILSLYRLTLGQPRQEELIELLDKEGFDVPREELFVNLSPFDKK